MVLSKVKWKKYEKLIRTEENNMDFLEYIKPELLILVPVLYVIGMAIKKTALIADKLIPLAVLY